MAAATSSSSSSSHSNLSAILPNSSFSNSQTTPLFPIPAIYFNNYKTNSLRLCCFAAKQQTGPVKKRSSSNTKKKKKPSKNIDSFDGGDGEFDVEVEENGGKSSERYVPLPLPKPPAGFVVDDQGRVLMASNKRIATIVDSTCNLPLECVIRRVFKSTRGDECFLLCPVDMPVQILKSANVEGWIAVSDEEVEGLLPAAAFALAKVHMHLVHSGFCYTARGGICYTEEDIIEFKTNDGEDIDGVPNEGIEIACFHVDGSHYMLYTPTDPLLFVAVKDKDGLLQIADDELLDDPAIISAVDEETEFNALVEEEQALLESLLGV